MIESDRQTLLTVLREIERFERSGGPLEDTQSRFSQASDQLTFEQRALARSLETAVEDLESVIYATPDDSQRTTALGHLHRLRRELWELLGEVTEGTPSEI